MEGRRGLEGQGLMRRVKSTASYYWGGCLAETYCIQASGEQIGFDIVEQRFIKVVSNNVEMVFVVRSDDARDGKYFSSSYRPHVPRKNFTLTPAAFEMSA